MVSPVVSAGFQKMVNLYRSVCIVSIHTLIFMNVYVPCIYKYITS